MHLDVFTMAVMITVITLTMAGCLLWVSRGSGHHGLKLFASALALFALSIPMKALRDSLLPESLSIIAGNLMTSTTFAILLLAVYRFHHARPNLWWILLPMILLAAGLLLMLDSLSDRIVFISLLFASQLSALGWATLRHRPKLNGDGHSLVATAAFACAAILAVRAVLEASGINSRPTFMSSELRYNYSIIIIAVAVIVFTLGFIFMVRGAVDEGYRQLSLRDDLTGIANRRHLVNQLQERLAEAGRTGTHLSLLLIDLDHFKSINDRLGHLAGDRVLREVARVIHDRVRGNDLVGRYGGEEFIVLLPGTSQQAARELAEELRAAVAAIVIPYGDLRLGVTVSIGVCGSPPASPLGRDALLEGADRAMYLAKEQGRNRVVMLAGH